VAQQASINHIQFNGGEYVKYQEFTAKIHQNRSRRRSRAGGQFAYVRATFKFARA